MIAQSKYCVNFDACSVRPAAHRFPMLSNASANALCWTSTQKPADERAERKPRFVYRMDGSALFREAISQSRELTHHFRREIWIRNPKVL